MFNIRKKEKARKARKQRVRNKVRGNAARPRIAIFKSARHIYAQLIDDATGNTLASASSLADEITGPGKARAAGVGKLLGERATEKGVQAAVFDRAGYKFHGQVKELAEAARAAGLKF